VKDETILLVTHSKDYFTIDHVLEAVSDLGYRPFRFNTDLFPLKLKLSLKLTGNNKELSFLDENGNASLNINDIRAIWLRKIWMPIIDEDMDPVFRNGCITESRETLMIFLKELESAFWIDSITHVKKAENKFYQLRMANKAGLKIPKTLISNNPEEVREFFHQVNGKMIAKLLTPLTISMAGNTPSVRTNRIQAEDLEDLESLRYSPMAFQECIEKKYELRIIYVDGELFTGAVDSRNTPGGETDWRASNPGTLKWEKFLVPEQVSSKIHEFMTRIGLHFGALDVILEPDGDYVFLEVNPTGEWGMLERDLGLPISKAIARALVKGIKK